MYCLTHLVEGTQMTINRRQLFAKAHFTVRGRKANGCPASYRELFAEALVVAYADARKMAEWKAKAAARQAQRDDELMNGLPLRSTPLDYARRSYFRTTRAVAAIGA